jgi:YVTN family beta-propeller protein
MNNFWRSLGLALVTGLLLFSRANVILAESNLPAIGANETVRPATTFPVPVSMPKGIASDPSYERLYVASNDTKSVVVLDELTQTVLKRIPVDNKPWGVGYVNNRVFVANNGSASVSVIDATAMTEVKRIKLNGVCDGGPANIAVDWMAKRVYVALYGMGRVAVIDATTNKLVDCISTNAGTFGVAVNPSLQQLYVTNRDAMDLQVFDVSTTPARLVQDKKLGGVPFFVQMTTYFNMVFVMVAFNPPDYDNANNLLVFTADSNGVTLSTTRIVGNTDDGGALLVSTASGFIYLAATRDNELQILDSSVYATCMTIPMTDPLGLTQDFAFHRVFVSNRSINSINAVSDTLCTQARP